MLGSCKFAVDTLQSPHAMAGGLFRTQFSYLFYTISSTKLCFCVLDSEAGEKKNILYNLDKRSMFHNSLILIFNFSTDILYFNPLSPVPHSGPCFPESPAELFIFILNTWRGQAGVTHSILYACVIGHFFKPTDWRGHWPGTYWGMEEGPLKG